MKTNSPHSKQIEKYNSQIMCDRAFNLPIQSAFAAKKFFTKKLNQLNTTL